MTDAATIAADPQWIPHALDMEDGRMQFLRTSRERLSATGFLGDLTPEEADGEAWLPFSQLDAMQIAAGPLHFIFHTAFCRSTLLARAMNIEGVSIGMTEPRILTQLAGAGDIGGSLVKPVCNLLSRPWATGEAVFVKPTNHANMLIPALLSARPDAKAVLMTNPLESFLRSLDKRALMGRRWGRQLYLEVMGYAGIDLGMDGREQFSMTDLQAAGLAWFLSQRLIGGMMGSNDAARLCVLDGDRFDADRAATLLAVAQFTSLDLAEDTAQEIANGPLFARHSKLGGEFSEAADKPAVSASFQQEVEQVEQWIKMIAQQAGVTVPAAQTLF